MGQTATSKLKLPKNGIQSKCRFRCSKYRCRITGLYMDKAYRSLVLHPISWRGYIPHKKISQIGDGAPMETGPLDTEWSIWESFRVICPNLLIFRTRADPDLLSIAYSIELSRILDNEANQRRCPHGPHDAWAGMTHEWAGTLGCCYTNMHRGRRYLNWYTPSQCVSQWNGRMSFSEDWFIVLINLPSITISMFSNIILVSHQYIKCGAQMSCVSQNRVF